MKEESEKVGLKLNVQKTKIMATTPITSLEIDGETVETVSVFILGGSKITADGDCSHEIKRCLSSYFPPKNPICRASLVVQLLRLHAPNVRTLGFNPSSGN